jgi:hypothetical protein
MIPYDEDPLGFVRGLVYAAPYACALWLIILLIIIAAILLVLT